MRIKRQPTMLLSTSIGEQYTVGDTVIYTLPHRSGFETDLLVALEDFIKSACIHYTGYKNNVQGKRDAKDTLDRYKWAKRVIEEMGEYVNVDGQICQVVKGA